MMQSFQKKDKTVSAAHQRENVPEQYKLSTYQYLLRTELIAQEPAATRDHSRLLVLNRTSGQLQFLSFADLPTLLLPSDLLVVNETKVIPAALTAWKPSGGRVEILVLGPAAAVHGNDQGDSTSRICITGSSKPLRAGSCLTMKDGPDPLLVEEIVGPGRAKIRFPVPEEGFLRFLDRHGRTPLPPYIKPGDSSDDVHRLRYQTVYARTPGSVAAPTAGLHFTEELLAEIESKGVQIVRIVLHVGAGTFTPVRNNDVRRHSMESEAYEISEEAAAQIRTARAEERRIIAVGTTSVRALESATTTDGSVRAGLGSTNLFIYPGYSFKTVRGLVTNFHLPGSTLLMLVCAFGGTEKVMKAYESAVENNFRFYSYGDACLIID